MKRFRIVALIAVYFSALLQVDCTINNPQSDGGGSGTGNANRIAGIIEYAGGNGPARCDAYLYNADAVPVLPDAVDTALVAQTSTDASGRFLFKNIADGAYGIYCRDTASRTATYLKGLHVSGNDSLFTGRDTLRFVESLSGKVTNAAGTRVVAFVYGSPFITLANDTSGIFHLRDLPTGKDLPVEIVSRDDNGTMKCRAHYRFTTMPDTSLFVSITLQCE